jgi:hypothetical protein
MVLEREKRAIRLQQAVVLKKFASKNCLSDE